MNIAAEHYLKLCWVAQNFRFLKKQVIVDAGADTGDDIRYSRLVLYVKL